MSNNTEWCCVSSCEQSVQIHSFHRWDFFSLRLLGCEAHLKSFLDYTWQNFRFFSFFPAFPLLPASPWLDKLYCQANLRCVKIKLSFEPYLEEFSSICNWNATFCITAVSQNTFLSSKNMSLLWLQNGLEVHGHFRMIPVRSTMKLCL